MPVVPLTARAIWCHDGLMQERFDARPGLTRAAFLVARIAEDYFAEWRLRAQEPEAEREAAALWDLHLQPRYDEADSVCCSDSGDASSVLTRLAPATVNTRKRLRAVEETQEALACRLDDVEEHSGCIVGPSWPSSLENRLQKVEARLAAVPP